MTETGNENIRRIEEIKAGKTALGIEFGSTRIKAVLIGSDHKPIASGAVTVDRVNVKGQQFFRNSNIRKVVKTAAAGGVGFIFTGPELLGNFLFLFGNLTLSGV